MSKIFFTSDYHLGHANIIKYCNRPFTNIESMNETIIRNHNNRVKPEDIVFHDGDFCFKNTKGGKEGEGSLLRSEDWRKRLNGNIIFIQGNHDNHNSLHTPIRHILLEYGGYSIFLVHNPEHYNKDYDLNFVGHVHEKWKFRKDNFNKILINVGVDVWKFMPVTFEEIISAMSHWKKTSQYNTKDGEQNG
jgi:calcineurin-like phosphoesterase family protein